MPWEVTIRQQDGQSLGSIEAVRTAFLQALPALQFFREPSGKEKLAVSGFEYPAILRQHLESQPAQINAELEAGDLAMCFSFGPETTDSVNDICIEVRGDGNPMPFLAAICLPNDWIAQENNGKALDLSADNSPAWGEFAAWRTQAVAQIKEHSS